MGYTKEREDGECWVNKYGEHIVALTNSKGKLKEMRRAKYGEHMVALTNSEGKLKEMRRAVLV